MKAWVVTLQSFEAAKKKGPHQVVLALLSVRYSSNSVRDFLERIFSILRLDLHSQIAVGKDSCRELLRANKQTDCLVYCVSHPYILKAQRSEIISAHQVRHHQFLRWKGVKYERWNQNPETGELLKLEEVNPPLEEAPQANVDLRSLFSVRRG